MKVHFGSKKTTLQYTRHKHKQTVVYQLSELLVVNDALCGESVFYSLPKAKGIYAKVMACVCVCVCVCVCMCVCMYVCDTLACKHDISRSKSCLNFNFGTLVGLGK